MSYWLIAVPNQGATEKSVLDSLNRATADKGHSRNSQFRIPPLKVGTLDTLMTLSDDLARYDVSVGQIAKKIEKTYWDQMKAGNEDTTNKDAPKKGAEAETLKVGNVTAREFVEKFVWNETRYPKRSPLRTLTDLIIKEANKCDENLKKQVSEYNEIRSNYTAIDRKDTGSLLVKPLGSYIKEKDLIEKGNLTTLVVVVPRVRKEEFEQSYELMEREAYQKEEIEKKRKEEDRIQREQNEKERTEEVTTKPDHKHKDKSTDEEPSEEVKEDEEKKAEAEAAEANRKRIEAEKEAERVKMQKFKKCGIVVPRSAKVLFDDDKDELILFRIVVLKDGAEFIKTLCREKRYTVRPYKYDPAEEKAEKEKKIELGKKKNSLHAYLIRSCSISFSEIFSSWLHLKAIRLYVESVLRYGLPVSFTAALLEPKKNYDRTLRETLKQLYGKLAGSSANLTSVDPNEVDLSGLGADFYPYVYLPLNLYE